MKRLIGMLLGMALLAAVPLAVLSQAFPAKPIRMLVPYPPGGIDPAARLMGPKMTEVLGQPIVIENLAGANGFIGTERAARSAPDGYTVLFATSSTLIAGVFLSKTVPFDPLKDFTPITNLYEPLHLIAVHASLPVNSVRELIDYAKKYPGKLSYSSSGIGSVFHLNTEIFKQAAGVDIVHVPYKGIAPAATDLAVGRVEVGLMGYTNFRPFLADSKLKLLAVLEPKRYARLPEIPALAEILPTYRKSPSWIGLLAPAGLPQAILGRLHAASVRALNASELQVYMEQNSNLIVGNTPEEFGKQMRADMEITGKLVKAIGIQPE
jgi:tripartite-type tricarboxylate transporter receptor subunit TctC